MLPSSSSLATVDFSNLQQLAVTAGVTITTVSAHTTELLDNVISQLDSGQGQWMIVSNVQLLADVELAMSKLVEVMYELLTSLVTIVIVTGNEAE